ncbi:unnamed protein product [Heligmosomoides polygyrus]|uniref:SB domain-containing protein n=1 Tax=Heligmosomoides polygyrus TaxID=6339 RepID=A0A183FBL2_HELPZ|nr:unnamed protein product [Heligmosomoides polygyrus]
MSYDMEREIDRIIEEDEQEQSRMAKLQQELAQLRQQVQVMAQQNALQVKLATTAISAQVSRLKQLPEQMADALMESQTSTPEGVIQEWDKLLEPGCEAILSVLPLLSEAALKVERTVADANKKHHEELSAVFDQAIHDDMSMFALAKLLDVESTRVVDTVKSLVEERQKGDSSQMSTIGSIDNGTPAKGLNDSHGGQRSGGAIPKCFPVAEYWRSRHGSPAATGDV